MLGASLTVSLSLMRFTGINRKRTAMTTSRLPRCFTRPFRIRPLHSQSLPRTIQLIPLVRVKTQAMTAYHTHARLVVNPDTVIRDGSAGPSSEVRAPPCLRCPAVVLALQRYEWKLALARGRDLELDEGRVHLEMGLVCPPTTSASVLACAVC